MGFDSVPFYVSTVFSVAMAAQMAAQTAAEMDMEAAGGDLVALAAECEAYLRGLLDAKRGFFDRRWSEFLDAEWVGLDCYIYFKLASGRSLFAIVQALQTCFMYVPVLTAEDAVETRDLAVVLARELEICESRSILKQGSFMTS